MATVRLGWETRLDRVTFTLNCAVLGLGAVLAGALSGWHGWFGVAVRVVLFVVGGVLLLVVATRLHGWQSLAWRRTLVADADGIADSSRKGHGFRVPWSDLAGLGVVSDGTALRLVLFPNSGRRIAGLAPLPGYASPGGPVPLLARLPHRAGVLEALAGAAPRGWPRSTAEPWLLAVGAQFPAPVIEEPVVVNAGRGFAWQGLAGGALAVVFGVMAMIGVVNAEAPPAARVVALVAGIPLLLLALTVALAVPVLLRRRHLVLDSHTVTWLDPTEESFTVGWTELSALSLEQDESWQLVLESADPRFAAHHKEMARFAGGYGRYVVPVGDEPSVGELIADAASRLAPAVWRGPLDDDLL